MSRKRFLYLFLILSIFLSSMVTPLCQPTVADPLPCCESLSGSAVNGLVISQVGTIAVTSVPPGATFSITGPASYSGTAPWSVSDAPVGDYTVAWGEMADYTKPSSITKSLAAGGFINFHGIYVAIPPEVGTIAVTSVPPGATFSITGPASHSGTAPWSVSDAPAGDYTVAWGEMAGYTTPLGETKTLKAGGIIDFYGDYAAVVAPTAKVAPASQDVAQGGTFSVDIVVDPSGHGVSAGEVNIAFDPSAMSADDIVFGDLFGANPAAGTKQIDNTLGTTKYALARVGITTPPTFAGIFATITFTAKSTTGIYQIDITSIGLADDNFQHILGTVITDGSVTVLEGQVGTIKVNSTLSGASFNITGPASYSGTAPWSVSDAPAGDYTVAWGEMAGYTTPPGETKTLTAGGTIDFTGNYEVGGWTNVFRDPKRGTALYINTTNETFYFTGPGGYTTGVQRATWMTAKKGHINFLWVNGSFRVAVWSHVWEDFCECLVTNHWRLKRKMVDPIGFEAKSAAALSEPDSSGDLDTDGISPAVDSVTGLLGCSVMSFGIVYPSRRRKATTRWR